MAMPSPLPQFIPQDDPGRYAALQGRNMIVTRTPLRVSLAGGGTDFADYYNLDHGTVLSTTIDHHIYVTVKRLSPVHGERYRLNYSASESVQHLEDIQNDIIRECLRLVPVEPPLYIATIADLPASSGLGSSSSFAVGLLRALHAMRNEAVSLGQLAEEACRIEIDILGRPIGKQDQYAAAFGGLNCIHFFPDQAVSIEPLQVTGEDINSLFSSLLLFWTGIQRDAGSVLAEQQANIASRVDRLDAMREQASELRHLLQNGFDTATFGQILDKAWSMKRGLASTISTQQIDTLYDTAKNGGAIGGKLCGAGGGGFLLLVAPPERHAEIRRRLVGIMDVPVSYCPSGSGQILPTVG